MAADTRATQCHRTWPSPCAWGIGSRMVAHRVFPAALAVCAIQAPPAQDSTKVRAFHDEMTVLIAQTASRPMTPGDTFLTWYPQPGVLIHTFRIDSGVIEASLLRGDRMLGTAHVEWDASRVIRFNVLWTRADTLHANVDSAISVVGWVDTDSIRITTPSNRALPVPTIPWGVADFGMEEQLIPVWRALSSGQPARAIAVLRPYHLKFDTVSVSVRDTAGLRVVEVFGERQVARALFSGYEWPAPLRLAH